MNRSGRTAAMVGLIALVVAAGCGSDDDDATATSSPDPTSSSNSTTTTTEPPSTSPTTSPEEPDPGTVPPEEPMPGVMTEDDDGTTEVMASGDEITLRLSNTWLWDQPIVSGDAVELVPVDYAVDPGYVEWLVETRATGSTQVTVAGEPNCGDEAACPSRMATFRFEVEG